MFSVNNIRILLFDTLSRKTKFTDYGENLNIDKIICSWSIQFQIKNPLGFWTIGLLSPKVTIYLSQSCHFSYNRA